VAVCIVSLYIGRQFHLYVGNELGTLNQTCSNPIPPLT
jgi:hypothetical protein